MHRQLPWSFISRACGLAALGLLASLGAPPGARAETRVGGTLQGTTVWNKAGSPYVVTQDIVIGRHATLRIEPGVTVRFKPNIASRGNTNEFDLEILVKGKLIVEGAAGDTVLFTSDAERPRWEDWQGIVVQGPDAQADVRAAIVEYALMGFRVLDGTLIARNVTIRNSMKEGISLIRAKAELEGLVLNEIGNPGGTGIGINLERQSEAHLRNCSIVGVQNGIVYSQGSGGTIQGGSVSMCLSRGVVIRNSSPEIRNCTITGNGIGFVISAGAAPVIQENNIFENGSADVQVREFGEDPVKLDFTRNWWGETALGLIEERILDGLDDPAIKAFTLLEPVLSEAVNSEVPSSDAP